MVFLSSVLKALRYTSKGGWKFWADVLTSERDIERKGLFWKALGTVLLSTGAHPLPFCPFCKVFIWMFRPKRLFLSAFIDLHIDVSETSKGLYTPLKKNSMLLDFEVINCSYLWYAWIITVMEAVFVLVLKIQTDKPTCFTYVLATWHSAARHGKCRMFQCWMAPVDPVKTTFRLRDKIGILMFLFV